MSYEAARISPVFRGFHSRNRNRGSGADASTDGLALSLNPPPEKHGAPASCPLEGCGVDAVSQIPRLLRDGDANSAVASPACLGLEASVVGWPGMKTIWQMVSKTAHGDWGMWGQGPLPTRSLGRPRRVGGGKVIRRPYHHAVNLHTSRAHRPDPNPNAGRGQASPEGLPALGVVQLSDWGLLEGVTTAQSPT